MANIRRDGNGLAFCRVFSLSLTIFTGIVWGAKHGMEDGVGWGKLIWLGLLSFFSHLMRLGETFTLPGWIRSYDSAGFFFEVPEVWLCSRLDPSSS